MCLFASLKFTIFKIEKAQPSALNRAEKLDTANRKWKKYIETYRPSVIENDFALSNPELKEGETFILDMGGVVQKFKVKRAQNYIAPKIQDPTQENQKITKEQIRLICEEIVTFTGNTPPQFGE